MLFSCFNFFCRIFLSDLLPYLFHICIDIHTGIFIYKFSNTLSIPHLMYELNKCFIFRWPLNRTNFQSQNILQGRFVPMSFGKFIPFTNGSQLSMKSKHILLTERLPFPRTSESFMKFHFYLRWPRIGRWPPACGGEELGKLALLWRWLVY